jgi:hypothetical protein
MDRNLLKVTQLESDWDSDVFAGSFITEVLSALVHVIQL